MLISRYQDVTSQAGLALVNYDSGDKLRVRLAVGVNRLGPLPSGDDFGMLFDAGAGYEVMKLPYGSGIYAGVEAATQLGGGAGNNVMPLFTLGVN